MGLKSDGTVVATGRNIVNQCAISKWLKIIAIAAGADHIVGLRFDGTAVATGYNVDGQCEVANWKLFDSIEDIETILRDRMSDKYCRVKEARRQKTAVLNAEKQSLQTELANLKGLFTGKRRREIEARLAQIETQLRELK